MTTRKTVTFWYGCNAVRHGDILHASKALLDADGYRALVDG